MSEKPESSESPSGIEYVEIVSTRFLGYPVRMHVFCPVDRPSPRISAFIRSGPQDSDPGVWINDEGFARLVQTLGSLRRQTDILSDTDLSSVVPQPESSSNSLYLKSGNMAFEVVRGVGLLGREHFTATIAIGDFEIKRKIDDKFFAESEKFLRFSDQMQQVVKAKIGAHLQAMRVE